MIERRKVYEVKLGDGSTLYRIVIESRETEFEGAMSTLIKSEMLKAVANNLDFLRVNNYEFESLEMKYKDSKWVIVGKVLIPNNS
jgi:hypothetical protein